MIVHTKRHVSRPGGEVKEGAVDILLVDDNPLMQQLIARFLGELGYQVGVAGRADEAVALARSIAPHLFLIDMHLPDLDGPEALLALRAIPGCAGMPAIAISGMDEDDARHVVTDDFVEYLTKPIDLDVLQATVERHIGSERVRSLG
jgi:two-component system NtrC family response regulator